MYDISIYQVKMSYQSCTFPLHIYFVIQNIDNTTVSITDLQYVPLCCVCHFFTIFFTKIYIPVNEVSFKSMKRRKSKISSLTRQLTC